VGSPSTRRGVVEAPPSFAATLLSERPTSGARVLWRSLLPASVSVVVASSVLSWVGEQSDLYGTFDLGVFTVLMVAALRRAGTARSRRTISGWSNSFRWLSTSTS
jgi:hypothetical protein